MGRSRPGEDQEGCRRADNNPAHDPITDHALTEFITSQRRAEAGAACINSGRQCQQGEESAARGSTLAEDQQPLPLNFNRAFSTHANAHGLGHLASPGHP